MASPYAGAVSLSRWSPSRRGLSRQGYPSITAAIFALDRIDFATGLRLAPLAGTSAAEETLAGAKDVEGSGKTAAFVCRLSSSLLKNLEMESFCILAGGCWGGAVELDVILQPGVGFDAG